MDGDPDARLLMTIPGVGQYAALALSSAIDGADRFADSHSLVAYFGLASTVRNPADKVHHGRITKKGNKLVRHIPSGGSPQPRAVRATLQAHAVLQAHPNQEGHFQGCSRGSFKDGAHHVPNAQERESPKHGYNSLIFHSGQVFKQRFL